MASDYRRYIGRTILVQLDDNEVMGVLERETGTSITLHDAAIAGGPAPVPLDGDIVIERLRILWVQVP